MKLNLTRPIIFFDLEATGLDVAKDRIVELCYIKVFPDGNEVEETMRLNPGMHISEQATAVNGITDVDVANCLTFKDVAQGLYDVFSGCDLAGFNSNKFDVPLLCEEFLRAGYALDITKCNCVDVQNIYHKLEQRTLVAAYKHYCGKDLKDAHSAMADTQATLEVLEAQLDAYPGDLKNDVSFLANFSRMNNNADLAGRMVYNDKGEILFNFGKHKGKRVEDVLRVEPGFYTWMMQGSFTQDTKQMLTKIYLMMKNKKRP